MPSTYCFYRLLFATSCLVNKDVHIVCAAYARSVCDS